MLSKTLDTHQIHRLPLQKRSPSIDWENLKVFIEIAAAGSFAGAARRMRVSQATVLRRTRALEEELGVILFERQAKGYRLTEHGAAFLRRVSGVEKCIALACRMALETEHTEHTEIRMAAPAIIEAVIARTLPAVYRRSPNVSILMTGPGQDSNNGCRAADVVIAIDCPSIPGFELEAIFSLPCGLYASHGYIGELGLPAACDQLNGHRIIDFDRGLLHDGHEAWQLLDRSGARIVPCSNSHYTRLQAAIAGLGMILLAEYSGRAEQGLVEVASAKSMGVVQAALFVRKLARPEVNMALACTVLSHLIGPASTPAPADRSWMPKHTASAGLLAASAE